MVAFQAKDALCQNTPAGTAAGTITQATFDQTAEDRMYIDCINDSEQCTNFISTLGNAGTFGDITINV